MANQKNLVHDDFVKQVRPDPKSTEQIIYMSGFIGKSPVDGHIRVYSDPELSNFVDVPENAIVHAVQHTKEESPLGGSKLWVKHAEITNKGAAGSFLEGDISNYYATNMYQPRFPNPGPFPPTIPPTIHSVQQCPLPPTRPLICVSFNPCITKGHPVCPPLTVKLTDCPTITHPPSVNGALCPVTVLNPPCHIVSLLTPCVTQNYLGCPVTVNNAFCPPITANPVCPVTGTILTTTRIRTLACPSIVDACPTAPTDTTIVVNPAYTVTQTIHTGAFNPNVHLGYYGY